MVNLLYCCSKFTSSQDADTFKVYFGITPDLANNLCDILLQHGQALKIRPFHLLWTLNYLKRYPIQRIICDQLNVDHKTYLKYVKICIGLLQENLEPFPWNEKEVNAIWPILGTVDVTRCKIQKPLRCPWEFYSVKDHFHALKYEVVCSFKKPVRIIWINGPYKGTFPDISIYRDRLQYLLDDGETLLADKGYIGDRLITPFRRNITDANEIRFVAKLNIARQDIERVNKRLKDWKFMSDCHRGTDYDFHGRCVEVIGKLTNLNFLTNPL